jgi:hypothetical protein
MRAFSLTFILIFLSSCALAANKKISELNSLPVASWASGDLFAVVDISSNETKKTTVSDFDTRILNSINTNRALGNLTGTAPVSVSGGTSSVIGAGATVSIPQATGSTGGYLASADFNTFNGKQDALPLTTKGDILTRSSSALVRFPVCTNGQVMQADSAQTSGWICASPSAIGTSTVEVHTGNGMGSTNTKIRRFTTALVNTGSDITFADSATLGSSFTVNSNGIYCVSYTDGNNASACGLGLSKNTTGPSTNIASLAASEVLQYAETQAASRYANVSWCGYLASGDVVRAHAAGTDPNDTSTLSKFVMTRVE